MRQYFLIVRSDVLRPVSLFGDFDSPQLQLFNQLGLDCSRQHSSTAATKGLPEMHIIMHPLSPRTSNVFKILD
jgi:hypothetical protein